MPTALATPSVAEAARRRSPSSSPVGRLTSSDSVSAGGFAPGIVLAERYRIIGLIGHGGMGEVYRADDLKLGQPVALKFLAQKLASEPSFIERFYAEVRHARGVSHPNVCRVYDVGEIEGRHFLSMEYVDGEDLASLLRRIGRLPPDKAVEIAREMCAGLAAAHDKGVLHRDLKPGNVMIDGRGRAKITDFGLAVGVEDDKGGAEVSGTPAYMAPEQLAGKGASVQSDVYALGLVLYELFTGRKAFEAATLAEWRRKHSEEPPTSPSTVTPGFDPVVERVILRCLEKDPKARPRSVAAVAAALPGGDPLAAAIAAGETPSPEMVAAAGEPGAITLKTARLVIAAVVVMFALDMLTSRYTNLLEMVPLGKPPDALVDRAKEIVRSLGYSEEPADTAQGFHAAGEYLRFLEQRDATASRWKPLATGWPAVHFWYRQSPRNLVAWNFFGDEFLIPGLVGTEDPPLGESGMVLLETSPRGNLFSFQAVPPQVDPSPAPTGEPDWAPLFAAAGLDPSRFKPVTPTWNPLAASDRRAAWEGEYPGLPGVPLRVEAAAYRGRPVFFSTIGPWTRPSMMQAYK
ncbi:MAG TPA: serine/threonine-protein kinase, partial [Thermoanaerobaculia bacterium]|nr:serine/threonine-protein kinase [Thermoanaerobaculia bacterium]